MVKILTPKYRHCSGCGGDDHDRRKCPNPGQIKCERCGGINGCLPTCTRKARPLGKMTMDEIIAEASKSGGKEKVKQWLKMAEDELSRTRSEIVTLKADEAVQSTRRAFLVNLLSTARE